MGKSKARPSSKSDSKSSPAVADLQETIEELLKIQKRALALATQAASSAEEIGEKSKKRLNPVLIDLAGVADSIVDAFAPIITSVKERIKAGANAGSIGEYYVASVVTTHPTRPAWKDLAVENRQKLAKLTGEKFDAEKYVENVQAKAPKGTSVTIKFDRVST